MGRNFKRYEGKYIDMDQIIEERQGMSISDIFARYGENYFREQENKLVKELSRKENIGKNNLSLC